MKDSLLLAAVAASLGSIIVFVYQIQHQAPAKPVTAAQPVALAALLAVTHCGELAGYVAVYRDGRTQVYPPLPAKPGTKLTSIETGRHCAEGELL